MRIFALLLFAATFTAHAALTPIYMSANQLQGYDVSATAPTSGQILSWSTGSSSWVPATVSGTGSVTSVAMTVPSFLSISGSPITASGTLAVSLSGTALPLANGGTGQTSAASAFTALVPSMTGNNGKFLTTNGSVASWGTPAAGSGVDTLAAVGSSPNANGASIASTTLTLQPADGTNPGVVTAGAQTIGGAKTFSGAISASNLSGTNSGDVTLAAVGSSPAAEGASISGQAITLQPADSTHPGLMTAAAQSFAGVKTFGGGGIFGAATTVTPKFIVRNSGSGDVNTTFQVWGPSNNNQFMIGGEVNSDSAVYFGSFNGPPAYAFITGHTSDHTGVRDLALQDEGGNLYLGYPGGSPTTNVGINIATPTAELHTSGTVRFQNFGAGAATFDASGNLSSASDERLKTNITKFKDGLSILAGISPISYRWNELSGMERDHIYVGFSAQNILKAFPLASGVSPKGYLSVQDRALLAATINAVNDLAKRVEALEKKKGL